MMTPTDHEKAEWSRLAQDAYRHDYNAIGHRYSAAASMCRGLDMPVQTFDALQAGYRQWLLTGFAPTVGAD